MESLSTMITTTKTLNGQLIIRLTRAEMRNALNPHMIMELISAFQTAIDDPEVRMIQLCGDGKIFCAGADMNWMKSMADFSFDENVADATRLAALFEIIDGCPKPTLAVIQGGAYGGGVGLVAACDIAIATENSLFCLSEVRMGIIPAVISPYLLQAIGERQTRRLTLTGERFDVQEAKSIGLVHYVVPESELESSVLSVTENILKGSPQAQSAAKKLFKDLQLIPTMKDRRYLTTTAIAQARSSQDGQEGLQAFLTKRDPKWCKS